MRVFAFAAALCAVTGVKGSTREGLRGKGALLDDNTSVAASRQASLRSRMLNTDSPGAEASPTTPDTALAEGVPTQTPTRYPTLGPSEYPTLVPSSVPTQRPSDVDTATAESGHEEDNSKNGFDGTESDPIYTVCEDVRSCFDGAVCVESPVDSTSYSCDCDALPSDSPNQSKGFHCVYEKATAICNPGLLTHFCTNDGECPKDSDSWPFAGCTCPNGYEGAHCQFWVGGGPSASPSAYATLVPSEYPSEMPSQSSIGRGSSIYPTTLVMDEEPESMAGTLVFPIDGTITTISKAQCEVLSCAGLCLGGQKNEEFIRSCRCDCT